MFERESAGGVSKEELSHDCSRVNTATIHNINPETSEVSITLDYGSYLGILCAFLGAK